MKMIILDLDGTILNKNGVVTKNTKEYLNKLKKEGIIITIATGRNYSSAMKATDQALFANYLITDTGSCIYDLSNHTILLKNSIDKKIVKRVLEYEYKDLIYIFICDQNFLYKYSDIIENNDIIKTVKDKKMILNQCMDVSHISIEMKNIKSLQKLHNDLEKELKDIHITVMQDSFADRKWLDIMPKNCSKLLAIKKLLKFIHIKPQDIIAFGDGLNDIEILKMCGRGVALKNALNEVKKVANDITTYDHDHDGVIEYLKEHL